QLFDEAMDAKAVVTSAQGKYRNVLKRAKDAGINIDELRDAMKLSTQDRDRREANHRDRMRYMIWLGKPLGEQGTLDLGGAAPNGDGGALSDEDKEAIERHKASEAYREGHYAGKCGASVESCPYQPGYEQHQQWRLGWNAGQEELVNGTFG